MDTRLASFYQLLSSQDAEVADAMVDAYNALFTYGCLDLVGIESFVGAAFKAYTKKAVSVMYSNGIVEYNGTWKGFMLVGSSPRY